MILEVLLIKIKDGKKEFGFIFDEFGKSNLPKIRTILKFMSRMTSVMILAIKKEKYTFASIEKYFDFAKFQDDVSSSDATPLHKREEFSLPMHDDFCGLQNRVDEETHVEKFTEYEMKNLISRLLTTNMEVTDCTIYAVGAKTCVEYFRMYKLVKQCNQDINIQIFVFDLNALLVGKGNIL